MVDFKREERLREVQKWFSVNGDGTLRMDYPLNEDSVVVDLGGYRGQFTYDIYRKYKCNVHVFEPYLSYYKVINGRFKSNEKIKVYDYGVSGKTEDLHIVDSNDGSYLLESRDVEDTNNLKIEDVKVKSFKDAYDEMGVDNIDLLKINVEGAEYDIMQNIFDSGLKSKINNYQIQFHYISPECENLLSNIREELSKTHKQDWNYEWVWENWSLK